MRVAHITKSTGIAGSERHLSLLLPGLRARGVKTCMLVLQDPGRPVTAWCRALREGVDTVQTIPVYAHFDPGLTFRLAQQLRAFQPDIVHTHLLHADLYGLTAARRAGVPHAVSSRHNQDAFRRNPLIKWLNRRAMRHAERVIAISASVARFVSEVEGTPPERVVTIYYGLDAPVSGPDDRDMTRLRLGLRDGDDPALIGFVGRLVHQKGADLALEAFAKARQRHPRSRLVIVGDGPERRRLEAQAERLALTDSVIFTGWVDDASSLMPAFDMVVAPSRWEGFGLVILEAMGRSLPVIASQAGAFPEIVADEQTGLLVPSESPDALANAMESLLGAPDRAADMGRAGKIRLAESFSVGKMVDATLRVYEQITTC
jgi:glycosyltransferase involved in cell wall biosynthesis